MVNRRARFVMGLWCGVVSVSTLCANDKKAKREMTADKREAKAIGASPSGWPRGRIGLCDRRGGDVVDIESRLEYLGRVELTREEPDGGGRTD